MSFQRGSGLKWVPSGSTNLRKGERRACRVEAGSSGLLPLAMVTRPSLSSLRFDLLIHKKGAVMPVGVVGQIVCSKGGHPMSAEIPLSVRARRVQQQPAGGKWKSLAAERVPAHPRACFPPPGLPGASPPRAFSCPPSPAWAGTQHSPVPGGAPSLQVWGSGGEGGSYSHPARTGWLPLALSVPPKPHAA